MLDIGLSRSADPCHFPSSSTCSSVQGCRACHQCSLSFRSPQGRSLRWRLLPARKLELRRSFRSLPGRHAGRSCQERSYLGSTPLSRSCARCFSRPRGSEMAQESLRAIFREGNCLFCLSTQSSNPTALHTPRQSCISYVEVRQSIVKYDVLLMMQADYKTKISR